MTLAAKLARKIEANPSIKTAHLAQTLGVAEVDVLRHWPTAGEVRALDTARVEDLLRGLEALGRLYVVCRSASCVLEVKGHFGGFSRSGPYFNVATETLHMHILTGDIGAGFAVIRPGRDPARPMRSLQFFDHGGNASFKVFLLEGVCEAGGDEFTRLEEQWDELTSGYHHA